MTNRSDRVDVGTPSLSGDYRLSECSDVFGAVLTLFDIAASTFFYGELCDAHEFTESEPGGMLHIARNGRVLASHGGCETVVEPTSVILYPRPVRHSYRVLAADGTDAVCARLSFRGGEHSPFVSCLPDIVSVSVEAGSPIAATVELMFSEAHLGGAGVVANLNRLSEVLVIQLVRRQLEQGDSLSGILAGLANTDLAPSVVALHQTPERKWTVDMLANHANMSRTRFATEFSRVLGTTPIAYLARLRVYLAMGQLTQGLSVSDVSDQLGFTSQSAFSRAFHTVAGVSPTQWRRSNQANWGWEWVRRRRCQKLGRSRRFGPYATKTLHVHAEWPILVMCNPWIAHYEPTSIESKRARVSIDERISSTNGS